MLPCLQNFNNNALPYFSKYIQLLLAIFSVIVLKCSCKASENGVQIVEYYDVYKKADNPAPSPYVRAK